MPCDLSDSDLIAPPAIRDDAISKLDTHGWNVYGVIYRQTWARIKLLTSIIREEALELSLCPAIPSAEQAVKAQ